MVQIISLRANLSKVSHVLFHALGMQSFKTFKFHIKSISQMTKIFNFTISSFQKSKYFTKFDQRQLIISVMI